MPLFHPQDIDHVVLRVASLDTMVRFYCDVLGCSVDLDRPELGMIHLRAGRAMIDLVAADGPIGARGGSAPGREGHNVDHFCLRVSPFDPGTITDYLAAQGVQLGETKLRYGAQGRGVSVYLTDPEGNTVELKADVAA